jgi:hypothetical protein
MKEIGIISVRILPQKPLRTDVFIGPKYSSEQFKDIFETSLRGEMI